MPRDLSLSPTSTPWLTSADAAKYLHKSRAFVLREINAGRLQGARIGGRGEILTRTEWCDAWVEDRTTPILLPLRRRRP